MTSHTSATGLGGAELAVRVCALPHPVLAAAVVLRDTSGEQRSSSAPAAPWSPTSPTSCAPR